VKYYFEQVQVTVNSWATLTHEQGLNVCNILVKLCYKLGRSLPESLL